MLKGFREFVLRGNVVDLAVAVVVGAAFGGVVTSFVADLLTPLIAAIGGKPDFSSLSFTINHSTFRYGRFVNALVSFLMVAVAVYFAVVLPLKKLSTQRSVQKPPAKPEEVQLLAQIRDLLEHPPSSPPH
jgi:large conductance mechanosensitive channel